MSSSRSAPLHFDANGFEVPVQGTGILGSKGGLEFLSRGK